MPLTPPPRRALPLLLTAVLAVPLALVGAAPADAAPDLRAEVAVSARVATPGARVTVTGTVRSAGHPLVRTSVVVQQRTLGTAAWRTLHRATTTSAGRVTVRSTVLTRSKEFRVRALAGGAVATSGASAVTVPTAVTVTATSPLTPTAGDAVVLAGTTSAQLAGRRIRLQWLDRGLWRPVASSVITADATFNVYGLATQGGDQQYRAFVKAAPGRAEAASDPVDFTVSAWYRLADLPVVDASPAVRVGRSVIGNAVQEQSVSAAVEAGAPAQASFSLGSRCTSFRALLGAESDSDVAFIGRWRLFADDDLALEATLPTGAGQQQTASITGAAVLRLRTFALTSAATAAWGNAEVLCAGRP